jgi:hypothetical protein
MYCRYKGKIYHFLNNCLQESLCLDLVMIQIIHFWILKTFIICSEFPTPPPNCTIGYYIMWTYEKQIILQVSSAISGVTVLIALNAVLNLDSIWPIWHFHDSVSSIVKPSVYLSIYQSFKEFYSGHWVLVFICHSCWFIAHCQLLNDVNHFFPILTLEMLIIVCLFIEVPLNYFYKMMKTLKIYLWKKLLF